MSSIPEGDTERLLKCYEATSLLCALAISTLILNSCGPHLKTPPRRKVWKTPTPETPSEAGFTFQLKTVVTKDQFPV